MVPHELGRFRKHRIRRKGKLVIQYWMDRMTGQLHATVTRA